MSLGIVDRFVAAGLLVLRTSGRGLPPPVSLAMLRKAC